MDINLYGEIIILLRGIKEELIKCRNKYIMIIIWRTEYHKIIHSSPINP